MGGSNQVFRVGTQPGPCVRGHKYTPIEGGQSIAYSQGI